MTIAGNERVRAGIGVSIVVAIGLGVWALFPESNEAACLGAAQVVHETWNEARRAELQHAYEHTEVAYARDAWLHTESVANEWFEAWAKVNEHACQEERLGAQQCLEAARVRADALLAVMADARPEAIAHGQSAFTELPPPARCLDVVAESKPREPQLGRIAAMVTLGLGAEALPKARGLEESEAALWVGTILMGDERPEAAREHLERAFSEPSLASDAAVALVRAMAKADQWEDADLAMVEREELGARAQLEAQALRASRSGTEPLQTVLNDASEQLGPGDPTTLAIASMLGEAALQRGALDEAARVFEDARAHTLEAYGAEHPAVAIVDLGLARVDLAAGRIDAAKAKLESAADALRSSLGPQSDHTIDAIALLARAHAQAGEDDDAQRLLNGAVEVSKRAKGPDHPRTRRLAQQLAAG